jgi:hypothetical protein
LRLRSIWRSICMDHIIPCRGARSSWPWLKPTSTGRSCLRPGR